MSNLNIPSSTVIQRNLVTLRSRVEGTNLILSDETDYVERFAPDIMDGNETAEALYGTEKDEIRELNDTALMVTNNAFLKTMDLNRMAQWEKALQITPYTGNGLEDRRKNIIQKMTFRPPYTRQNFQSILEGIWGKGDYTFEIYPNEFLVIIDIHENNPRLYFSFQETIRNIIPANMYVVFSIQYTHLYLNHTFKYGEMEEATYGELSKYADQTPVQRTDSIWQYIINGGD